MTALNNALSNILYDSNEFCRLCFKCVGEDAIQLQDEVYLKPACSQSTEDEGNTVSVFEMLMYIMGEKYANSMCIDDYICVCCMEATKTSYNFVKTAKEYNDRLHNNVTSLTNYLKKKKEFKTVHSSKSLFILLDSETLKCQHFCDKNQSFNDIKKVLSTFKSLLKRKSKQLTPNSGVSSDTEDSGWGDLIPENTNRVHTVKITKISEAVMGDDNIITYKCKECSKIIKTAHIMKRHYYRLHAQKSMQCDQCSKSFASETILKEHKHDSHGNNICNICGKIYQNRRSMQYHMRQHTGEEPYECEFCNQRFKWPSRRLEHIRRYHIEPSVECKICHKMFKTQASMYDHKKLWHLNKKTIRKKRVKRCEDGGWESDLFFSKEIRAKII